MPAQMNTDAARRASRTYHAKREAEGLKKVTLWLSPEARAKLETLKVAAGSKDKAAELAIMAYGQKAKAAPAKPPAVNGSPGLVNAPPSSSTIPFAGDMQRKPYQKGPRK